MRDSSLVAAVDFFPYVHLSSCLTQLLDKLHMDDRHADRPLRVPVLDRYNDRGTMVLGKVEQVRSS